MSSYAVDVSDPSVQEAMHALGVTTDELLVKPREEFVDPAITAEVFELRYEYYQNKLAETVQKIQNYQPKSSPKRSIVLSPSSVSKDEVEETKKKNQDLIRNILLELQQEVTGNEAIENKLQCIRDTREKIVNALTPAQQKFMLLKDLQQKNYSSILREQEKLAHKDFSKTWERPSGSVSTETKNLIALRDHWNIEDVVRHLDKLENKLQKSRNRQGKTIQTKIKNATKDRDKIERGRQMVYENRTRENLYMFNKLANKQSAFVERRHELIDQKSQEIQQNRKSYQEKIKQKLKKLKEFEKIERRKIRAIERRQKVTSLILEQKQLLKDQELQRKQEINRLKDYDAHLNHTRNLRILVSVKQGRAQRTNTRKTHPRH